MKVLIACEESQVVLKEFLSLGSDVYSCDLEPCSGEFPERHLRQDVIPLLNDDWDLIIAHPPCTYLTICGNKWMNPKFKDRFPDRQGRREEAIEFFMKFALCKCNHIAIENPVGIISTTWRKPDQYVEPFWFGDPQRKKTGLWLKNLPKLEPTNIVKPKLYKYKNGKTDPAWHWETKALSQKERSRIRSRTFTGFAKAMAEQWFEYVKNKGV